MQVSQIYLSDSTEGLPPYLLRCTDTVKASYPQFPYVLYGKETLRQFLLERFDSEVVEAYDKLVPYSFKADLGKYCLLYELGGWYFDVSIRVVHSIVIPDTAASLAFRDIQVNSGTSWAVSCGVIYSKAGNPVFQTAIKKVIQNCRNGHYGITPLCPTGPTVLGQAFALNDSDPNSFFGDLVTLTPSHAKKNAAFVVADGTIVAFLKPSPGGDLEQLGAKGTNNYNELYAARRVYHV